jgi:hypothetical protein
MSRTIRLSWPTLGESVIAELADEDNPELCDEFWAALPFTITQEHPVVSGESMYSWTPLVSTAVVRKRIAITACPVGALRYSQSTGNKLSVQYGPGQEPLRQPYLGQVREADLDVLPRVGKAVWENLFWQKGIILLTVERVDDDGRPNPGGPAESNRTPSALEVELEAAATAMLTAEPEELTAIRQGRVPDTGTYGQYFTAWDFANGMIRDYVMYMVYPLLTLADTFEPAAISKIFDEFDPPYSSYLGYSGLHELDRLATAVGDELRSATSREQTKALLTAFVKYGNRLCSWSYHYFPHYLGIFYRRGDSLQEFPGRWSPAPSPVRN